MKTPFLHCPQQGLSDLSELHARHCPSAWTHTGRQPSHWDLSDVVARSTSHRAEGGEGGGQRLGKVREAGLPSPAALSFRTRLLKLCVSLREAFESISLPSKCAAPPTTTLLGQALLPDNVTLKRSPSPPRQRRLRKALRSVLSRYTESQSSSKSFILSLEQLLQHPRPAALAPVET